MHVRKASPTVADKNGRLNPIDRKKSPNGGRSGVKVINCDINSAPLDNVMTSLKNIVKPPPPQVKMKQLAPDSKSASKARQNYANRTNSKNHSNAGGSKDATRNTGRDLAPSLNIPTPIISRPPTIPTSPNHPELATKDLRQATPDGKYTL